MKTNKDEELQALRNRVAELESERSEKSQSTDVGRSFYRELEDIKKKGKNTSGNINYKDIHDHRNISLYHTNGLRIGKALMPVHPANAEYAFKEFDKIGILLSLNKPSEESINAYKETDEYKKLRAAYDKERKFRQRSRKSSEVDKLTEAIAKMQNIPVDQVNRIRPREEVTA